MTEAAVTIPPRRPGRLSTAEFIDSLVDPGSWRSWDEPLTGSPQPDPGYVTNLAEARARTGLDEAVVTGAGRISGRRVAVVTCEFDFLAGSIGVAAAERLARAVERATRERLPLLASPASGGTRMQEGTVAFLQMVKVAGAIADHKADGLPYLVYLRHPTTGGALASWGSLGHVTMAEPGALIGFLGPRVYQALHGQMFPSGVQVAENLHGHGLVDAVVPPEDVAEAAARILNVLCPPRAVLRVARAEPDSAVADVPTAESLRRSRRPERPSLRALLNVAAREVTPLSGTGAGETDPGLLLALARIGHAPCVLLGQDRLGQRDHGPLGPAALRMAQRGMRLAVEFGLPLVSVIDTAGAALSREAEEGGLAAEIARCLAGMVRLPVPTLSVLLGEGAGGGALALLPADRVVAAQHAWLSPLPPEGASAIRYRTTDRAAEIAEDQQVRSLDLKRHGIVDRLVGEYPDAADEPGTFLRRLGAVLEDELATLLREPPTARMASRRRRYRTLGVA